MTGHRFSLGPDDKLLFADLSSSVKRDPFLEVKVGGKMRCAKVVEIVTPGGALTTIEFLVSGIGEVYERDWLEVSSSEGSQIEERIELRGNPASPSQVIIVDWLAGVGYVAMLGKVERVVVGINLEVSKDVGDDNRGTIKGSEFGWYVQGDCLVSRAPIVRGCFRNDFG